MGITGIREERLVQIEITVLKNCLDFKTYWMWEVIKKEVSKKTLRFPAKMKNLARLHWVKDSRLTFKSS